MTKELRQKIITIFKRKIRSDINSRYTLGRNAGFNFAIDLIEDTDNDEMTEALFRAITEFCHDESHETSTTEFSQGFADAFTTIEIMVATYLTMERLRLT